MLDAGESKQFREQGYVIRRVLDDAQVARYIDAIVEARRGRGEHAKMMNLQFLQPGRDVRGLQEIICNEGIHAICRDLLGDGNIIIDGASVFYGEAGVEYRQKWHRDVLQVPDERIDPDWFSEGYDYNYVQVNIPLTDDGCLWIVPGSHRRQMNAEERALFGPTDKMAPVDRELSGGRQIVVPPGHAVFYNNYAIHRGYGGTLTKRRVTVHLGFHSDRAEPTLHFGVLDHNEYTPEYLAGLDAPVRAALQAHVAERARYPRVDEYHALHQAFLRKEFATR